MWEYRVLKSLDEPQYDVFGMASTQDFESYLNDLGAQGWEIVTFYANNNNHFDGLAKRQVVAEGQRRRHQTSAA